MWSHLNKPPVSTSAPRRTDFSSTWDAPRNPGKAKSISDQEFLKLLNPTAVVRGCAHETKRVTCPCGKCLVATRCIHCSVTFCSEECGKKDSALNVKPVEDEENWNLGSEKPAAMSENGSNSNCNNERSSRIAHCPVQTNQGHLNSGIPKLNPFRDCVVKDSKSSINFDGETQNNLNDGAKNKNNADVLKESLHQDVKKELLSKTNEKQNEKNDSLYSAFPLGPVSAASTNTVGVGGSEGSKLHAYNKKLVAGRGRSRGRSVSSGSSSVTSRCTPSLPTGIADEQSQGNHDLATSFTAKSVTAEIPKTANAGQYDDVEDTVVGSKDDGNDIENVELSKYLSSFPQQARLESLEGKLFVVTHVYSVNRIHIISSDDAKNRRDDLLDDINDACKDASSISGQVKVGDLVCAPSDKGFMDRAVVIRELPGSQFRVKFLDFGGIKVVSMSDMKSLQHDLLQTPLLGYEVKLENLEQELPRLLGSDMDSVVRPWLLEQKKLKLMKVIKLDDVLYEAQFSSNKFENLAARILEFQIWEWEKLFLSGKKNDFDILNEKKWELKRYFPIPLSYFPDRPVLMECSRVNKDGIVTFKNIEYQFIKRELNVLQLQINRYVDTVNALQHYPKNQENFLLLPDPKLSCGGYWRRANRVDNDTIYCVDTDECLPLKMDHGTRFMCPEFLKVPYFVIKCELVKSSQVKSPIKNATEKLEAEVVKKTFVQQRRYAVTVVGYDAKTDLFKITMDV